MMEANDMTGEASRFTRREFVRTAAIGAAATAGALMTAPRVWGAARADDRVRIGLIGCGGRGRGAAMQAISADPGALLWSVGDVFPDQVDATMSAFEGTSEFRDRIDVAPERRFVGFDAYRRVIDSGVDVVILAAPPHFRPAHLEAAVEARKAIFCEKPMCVDVPGYHRVIGAMKLADERGLNLSSGFVWRSSLPEREFVRELRTGRIGDVVAVHAMYLTSPLGTKARKPEWSDMEFQLRNWQHFTWLSGDHIVEQAVHSVDKILWFMDGKLPVRCTAVGGRGTREDIPERGDSYDHFAVVYEYEGGERATLTCRQQQGTHFENTDALVGTRGFGFVNGWGPTQRLTGATVWEWASPTAPPNMYETQQAELIEAVRGKRDRIFDRFMADSCLMAIMGREAAYTGDTVAWNRFKQDTRDLSPTKYELGNLPFPAVVHPGKPRLT